MATKTDHRIVLSAVDRTKSAFRSMQMGLKGAGRAIFSLQTALAGLGAVAALTKISRDIDNLAKTSAKLGIAVGELQALRHAAELSGVATGTLDMAMQRFTRRLAEARAGTGEAKAALEEMGIAFNDSQGNARAQTDVLNDVADALQQVPNQADRVRLAFKLFDSEGVALVNMLQNGSAGLKQMTDEFKELGLAISAEETKKVEAFNDAMQRLGTLFTNIGQKIGAAVLPRIQKLIMFLGDKLLGALIAATKGLQSFFDFAVDAFNSISEATGGFIGKLTGPEFSSAIQKLEDVRTAFRRAVGPETQLDIQYTGDAVVNSTNKIKDFGEATKSLSETMGTQLRGVLSHVTNGFTDLITGTRSASEAFKNMARSIINDLVRMAVQKQITDRIFGAMMNFVSPSISTASGFTSMGPAAGTSGGSAGTFFANGGLMKAGRPAIVGERGPEMVIPNRNSTVVPNHQLGGGGGTIVQNINISTGVQQTVRTEIMSMLPMIANASKAAVADARKRGGAFASAFGG